MNKLNKKKLVMVGISRKGERGFNINKQASLTEIKKFFPSSTSVIPVKKINDINNDSVILPDN